MEQEDKSDSANLTDFKSWRSYWDFSREVSRGWRYVRSADTKRFLNTLIISSRSRVMEIPAGRQFYRAQVAQHDELDSEIGDTLPQPALPDRMRPFRDRATEGRVNPKGIPCLYLAADKHTAIAESRPWIGSLVSVGIFHTERTLRIVDCTRSVEKNLFYLEGEPAPEEKEETVWAQIARGFRQPITRDDNVADYAPTQVIAEIFRGEGYDGIAYRSAFGTDRFNIVLFDIDAAHLSMCELHEIKDVELKYDQAANPYYVKADDKGHPILVRNVIVGFSAIDDKDTKD